MIITKTIGNTIKIINSEDNNTLLVVDVVKNGTQTTLVISGSVKTHVASALSNIIMEILKNVKLLTLDFKEVLYIASAGLRALLTAQQYVDETEEGIDMIIENINDEVRDVFESTGFINILNVKG